MEKITAGDKGGFSYTPPKSDGMDDPGPRCPKCGWHVSRAVKAEDRTVVVACLNAHCDYTLTMRPGGIKDEASTHLPAVQSGNNSEASASLVHRVRSFL